MVCRKVKSKYKKLACSTASYVLSKGRSFCIVKQRLHGDSFCGLQLFPLRRLSSYSRNLFSECRFQIRSHWHGKVFSAIIFEFQSLAAYLFMMTSSSRFGIDKRYFAAPNCVFRSYSLSRFLSLQIRMSFPDRRI